MEGEYKNKPMSKSEEMVLVIRRSLFERLGSFQGIRWNVNTYLSEFLSRQNNFFLRRGDAEMDPSHKQLIPYAVFTWQDKLLYYIRGLSSGEQRLVALGSIGIGGHINDSDEGLFALDQDAYRSAVHREIREELRLEGGFRERIVGLINDDSNEVGRVHLGVVHLVELESPRIKSGEAAIRQLKFLPLKELRNRKATLETWSQLLVTHWEELTSGSILNHNRDPIK